ncbi:hypothetical protein ACFFOU_01585 [Pseudonocardia sulfidoxydans]|uniref:hypothetical protein n=1 Tax=Pseudonocardia sulfidoxydans TaxID=54011 RepID=UPI0011BD9DFB|nr:hypothetical protein [Pseudonocardia sulfidoxydans]
MTAMAHDPDPDDRSAGTRDDADVPTNPEGPTETEETVDRLEEEVLGGRVPDGVEPPPEDGTAEPPD